MIITMCFPTRQQDVVATSWKRLFARPSDVASTSEMYVLRRFTGTSTRYLIGTSRRRLKRTWQWCHISMSPRRLKQFSNETPKNVSVARRQDVSVVRILDVWLVRTYDVSCKSQMKHPGTSLCYVSTT